MRVYDVRDSYGDDPSDDSFQIMFGSEGEFLSWNGKEDDVVWVVDTEADNEVGLYIKDIDNMIRALNLMKVKLKETEV
jgi:hypothetical protein